MYLKLCPTPINNINNSIEGLIEQLFLKNPISCVSVCCKTSTPTDALNVQNCLAK